jgi:hypothetical protein
VKEYVKKGIENWYNENYGDDSIAIIYNEKLQKKESIHCHKINTPFGDIYAFSASPSKPGLKASVFLKAENEDINITKDNIHLYYKFMSDEDKANMKIGQILYIIHAERYKDIRQAMIKDGLIFNTKNGVDADLLHDNRDIRKFNSNTVIYYYDISYFGVKDTLKPIDEYIEEIKQCPQYQEHLLKKNTFIDDSEKMSDFFLMSKKEFLDSYSYLDEEEYDATKKHVDSLTIEQIEKFFKPVPAADVVANIIKDENLLVEAQNLN